jgi:hypothetical protein
MNLNPVLALALATLVAPSDSMSAAQKTSPKSTAAASHIPWERLPVCLQATASRDSSRRSATTMKWASARHDVHTSRGAAELQLLDDEVVLTLEGHAVTVGSDIDGKPINLGDWSVTVWAVPDCGAPAYLFIEQQDDGSPVRTRRWFFDPNRTWQSNELAVIEFPGKYGTDTVLTLRGNTLSIANDVGEATEKTLHYQAAPVYAFVQTGVQPKYFATINKSNSQFFENSATSAALKSNGQDVFEMLRTRTSVGTATLFGGRYLIMAGATSGDFQRHAVAVVDAVDDASFYVLCDDEPDETGALVGSSAGGSDRHDDDILKAFRSAGFSLVWNDAGRLVCDGQCHDER